MDADVRALETIVKAFEKIDRRHVQLATLRWVIDQFEFTPDELFADTVIPGPLRRDR